MRIMCVNTIKGFAVCETERRGPFLSSVPLKRNYNISQLLKQNYINKFLFSFYYAQIIQNTFYIIKIEITSLKETFG